MQRSTRVQILVFLIFNVLLVAFIIAYLRHPAVTPKWEVPEQRARIDGLVAEIAKENWQQSIENILTNNSQFFAEGYGASRASAELQLEEVVASRRAVKVLTTLSKLRERERIQKCQEMFDRALHAQEDAAFENVRLREEFGPHMDGRGRYQPIHAVCLALFATAETGHRDVLAEQFKKVYEFRKQFAHLIADKKSYDHDRALCIKWCIPQPRFQLNVIRLAVLRDPQSGDLLKKIDAYCQSKNLGTNEVPVAAWDARTTWFEGRVGSPIDESKGITIYMFYDWAVGGFDPLTATEQEKDTYTGEIVEKIRELALHEINFLPRWLSQ